MDDPLTEPYPHNFTPKGGSCPNDGAIGKRILTTLIHPSSNFWLFHIGIVLERGLSPTVPTGAPPVSGATLLFA